MAKVTVKRIEQKIKLIDYQLRKSITDLIESYQEDKALGIDTPPNAEIIEKLIDAVDTKKRLTADHAKPIANLIGDYRRNHTALSHDGRIENLIQAIEAPITKTQKLDAERFKAFEDAKA